MLKATGNANLPAPGWPNLAVYVPEYLDAKRVW
jgi:ribonuclease J